jgi:hypothetical protein
VLAVAGVVGSIVMTLAHLDLGLPVIEALGPGRSLPPVAAGFAVGALLFAVVAYAAFRQTAWAWPVALVVNALAFVSAVFPVRGVEALVPALVTLAALVILLSRPGRDALLYRRTSGTA